MGTKASLLTDYELIQAVEKKHGDDLHGVALELFEDARRRRKTADGMTEGQRLWLRRCYNAKSVESNGKPSNWRGEWILDRKPWVA